MKIKHFSIYLMLIQFFTVALTMCLFNCATEKNSTEKISTRIDLPANAIARYGRGAITDIAYSPDGMHIAIGSYVGAWVYHVQHGEALTIPRVDRSYINALSFSPDGRTLATGSLDGTVRLWDTSTYKYLKILTKHMGGVENLRFFSNGRTLASMDSSGTVRLWNVSTGDFKVIHIETSDVRSISFSSDGQMLAIGSRDNTVRLWDVPSGIHPKDLQSTYGQRRKSQFFA